MRLVLWPRICTILVNDSHALEKNIYSVIVGGSVLKMSLRLNWLLVLFKSYVSLLIFCLLVLPIIEKGVEISNSNCGFVSFSLQICHFLLHLFWNSVNWSISIILLILIVMKSSCTNIAILVFFWLILAQYMFFQLFTFFLFCLYTHSGLLIWSIFWGLAFSTNMKITAF